RARKAGRGAIYSGWAPATPAARGPRPFAGWPGAILPMGASAARSKSPATLVDALGDAPSDGGSIPPASTRSRSRFRCVWTVDFAAGDATGDADGGGDPPPPPLRMRLTFAPASGVKPGIQMR